jgi:metallo-beta-lactamase family protein
LYGEYVSLLDKAARDLWRGQDIEHTLPNLKFTRTADESRELNFIRSGAIIIAGSGMCTGGRIRHHLMHNIGRSECHVIIVGYQAEGTPGRALVEGAKTLRIFGETLPVRAKVHTIGGLSAHAGQGELVRWYDHIAGRPPLVLVHGERRAQQVLKARIEDELAASVHIAATGEVFDLARPVPF